MLAAIPLTIASIWATVRTTNLMDDITLAEWAILTISLTVICCISQIGFKPGYMQEVTDVGKENRLPALYTSIIMLMFTGLVGGLLLTIIFSALHSINLWNNLTTVFLLPLHCIITNAVMMFHTDLRILGKAYKLAWLSIVQIPIFIFALEICIKNNIDPLTSFFLSNIFSNIILFFYLLYKSKILKQKKTDFNFIKRACWMGLPVMGSLLSRYSCDLVVVATFRWGMDNEVAGLFGTATRLCEPLMLIFIGSFQMAWGAHIYEWIKSSPSGKIISENSKKSWLVFFLGLPIGLFTSLLIWFVSFPNKDFESLVIFILMLISRILAFGMASSMGFGQTMKRSYTKGLKVNSTEFLLTIIIIPFSGLYLGANTTLILCGLLPWISVLRIRNYSLSIVKIELSSKL